MSDRGYADEWTRADSIALDREILSARPFDELTRAQRRTLYAAGRPKVRHPRPEKCTNCGTPVRANHHSEADYPGTVRYGAGGVCQPCYRMKPEKRGLMVASSNTHIQEDTST